jgi:hypothetical protein
VTPPQDQTPDAEAGDGTLFERLAWLAGQVGDALDRLADCPAALLFVLLAANALALPYAGFSHDSRLYAAQVVERTQPGSFATDLYLRYGSQDKYSVFTLLVAPLVAAVGLAPTFFLLYLASKALYFYGAIRLVRALVPEGRAVVLGLLYNAVIPMPFGGNEIFQLNESFLTPRVAACGLVFLGLERMLAGRLRRSLAVLAAALVLHPLMAFVGFLVFALWWALTRLSRRQLLAAAAAACALAAVVVGYEPLGRRVFGYMDDPWRDVIFEVCFFIRPQEWAVSDWLRLACAVPVVAVLAWGDGPVRATFLRAILLAAAAGMVGTLVAAHSHYRLLIQASPYRTLWLTEFLAPPLAFGAAVRLWRRDSGAARCAALLLVLLVTCNWRTDPTPGVFLFLACLPPAVVGFRGLRRAPHRPDWLARSAVAAFTGAVVLMAVADLSVVLLLARTPPTFELDLHPVQALVSSSGVFYKLPLLALAGLTVWGLARRLGLGPRFRVACLALWLGYQTAIAGVGGSAWYNGRYSAAYANREFVAAWVRERIRPGAKPPSIFWPTDLRYVWFEAGAHSWFNPVQMSGAAFNRGTALEGKRRARLVGRFEVDAMRREGGLDPWWRTALLRLFDSRWDDPAPTADDLFRLAKEPALDLVVSECRLDGLFCATDGRYFLYDCATLRALARTPTQAGAASAGTKGPS